MNQMMKLLCVILVAIGGTSFAATRMYVDSVRFFEPDGNVRMEFPIAISRSQLYYRTGADGKRFTSYRIRLRVLQDTTLLAEDMWDRVHKPQDNSSTSSGYLPDLASISLPIGDYRVELELTDSAGRFRERATIKKLSIAPRKAEFGLSGLLLCSDIQLENGSDEFHRNGYRVVPFAGKTYGQNSPVAYAYWEFYGQANDTVVEYSIDVLNDAGKPVRPTLQRHRTTAGDRGIGIEAVPLRNVATGDYSIRVKAISIPSNCVDSVFALIRVVPSILGDDSETNENTATHSTELDEPIVKLNDIHYIVDESLLEQIRALEPDQQMKWVLDFWNKHDPDPATRANEYMHEYRLRLQTTERYSFGDTPGWKTDRGRIMIEHGAPDEVVDNTFESAMFSEVRGEDTGGNRPYIIWRYNSLAGGVIFVFGDRRLWGNYELMHSTMPGERRDEYWKTRLKGIK